MPFLFGAFRLDERTRQLLARDRPIPLSPKAFDLLLLLIERQPDVVSKADIHRALWPDTFVADVNLPVLVAEIRQALRDTARQPTFIRTVHRHGYAFCGTATPASRGREHSARTATWWLAWHRRRAALRAGHNIVGRDPDADVCVDVVGVSRRHALIVISDDSATLHDLASKNGTFVGGVRVTSPAVLHDGTEIRLGSAAVSLRRILGGGSTETVV